jgi:hypothetical protein
MTVTDWPLTIVTASTMITRINFARKVRCHSGPLWKLLEALKSHPRRGRRAGLKVWEVG